MAEQVNISPATGSAVTIVEKPARRERPLTMRQQLFIKHYLETGDPEEAYRRAGYRGRSGHNIQTNASHLLYHPRIQQVLRPHILARVTPADISDELASVAFSDWEHFLQIKTVRGEIVDVRMPLTDKVKALELLAKIGGMFPKEGADLNPVIVPLRLIGVDVDAL